jgi:predicted TPR repeat methyltransferase
MDDTRGAGARYRDAVALHRDGRLQEAAALYRTVLDEDPAHAGALHLLGVIEGQSGRYSTAADLIARAIDLDPNVAAAHANLGNTHLALGIFDKALASYERALAFQPDHGQALKGRAWAYHGLGRLIEALSACDDALRVDPDCAESLMCRGDILVTLGRTPEGVVSLRRAVECGADAERVGFVLASIGLEPAPPAAPPGYVRDLFDEFADRFDQKLVGVLHYRVPERLTQLALRDAQHTQLDVLDLGCGTGLCGPLLRPFARRLTGVDLSSNMLARARARGVYDELECAEITEYLSQHNADFDLVIAADVFVYFGDLAPLFTYIRRVMRAGSRFAFSVERADGDCELAPTRRYRHTRPYLERVAATTGFVIEYIETCVLRRDDGQDVEGFLAQLRAAAPG